MNSTFPPIAKSKGKKQEEKNQVCKSRRQFILFYDVMNKILSYGPLSISYRLLTNAADRYGKESTVSG